MIINIKHLLFLLGVLFFLVIFPFNLVKAFSVNAPIIVSIEHMGGEYTNRPLIKGLTPANTDVMVYFDGKYYGNAHINEENTKTNNFYFQSVEPISPGDHTVSVVAKDRLSLVLSSFSNEISFTSYGTDKEKEYKLPAPTLIEPNEKTVTAKVKPLIKGLTFNNTYIHVIIDGVYNGKIKVKNNASGVANFAYQPFLNLNVGSHRAWVFAEDLNGKKSENSNILYFNIEAPLPAPTLFDPVINESTTSSRPFIVGLSKNDLMVNVYVDHKLNGSFNAGSYPSGTASFAYKPFSSLGSGNHLIYTTATDSRGKESAWSNLIYYRVTQATTPSISEEAASEEPIVKSEEEEFGGEAGSESNMEEGSATEKEITDDGLEEILNIENVEKEADTGAINESKEQQGGLKLNLIIFILFLLAIILWIFWVNRELIKEKRAQSDDEDGKDKKPKLDL